MELRRSRVLEKLRGGELVSCVKLNLADARVAEIAAMAGFDCTWLCMEHVPNTLHDVENQIRAAKMHDMDALVRVPRGSYSDLIKPLEMDAAGIMVPHVMSAEDARSIVRQTRFHPIGRRAMDGGNADGAYTAVPAASYVEHANTQRFLIVQIEDPEAMEELDEIASIEGIDMLLFGPGDFSQALGSPGQLDHPRVREAREAVAAAANRHGKFAGTPAKPDQLAEYATMGYRFLPIMLADVVALQQGFNRAVESFEQVRAQPLGSGPRSG